jgi:hypothetical protein
VGARVVIVDGGERVSGSGGAIRRHHCLTMVGWWGRVGAAAAPAPVAVAAAVV